MGGRVPTWRMVPGSSTESLALDVALQCQVPADIVQRAAHLFKVSPVKPPSRTPLCSEGFCAPHAISLTLLSWTVMSAYAANILFTKKPRHN